MSTGQSQQEYEQEEESESEKPVASRYLVVDDNPTYAMAGAQQRKTKQANLSDRRSSSAQKESRNLNQRGRILHHLKIPQHILDQIGEFNENYANKPPGHLCGC